MITTMFLWIEITILWNKRDRTPGDRVIQDDEDNNVPNPERQSSWRQRISEVRVLSPPTLYIRSFHLSSRELIPYMRRRPSDSEAQPMDDGSPKKPSASIVNVSSREGLPERRQTKNGGRAATNAVDPGYMSVDPDWMRMIQREVQELLVDEGGGSLVGQNKVDSSGGPCPNICVTHSGA
ncbi:hypothetical protein AX14_003510 [Amanita brunnescens Koide BX004]|nr:hypothetical protein AX14_003510 [Amanita brunnescens Koide BX004]